MSFFIESFTGLFYRQNTFLKDIMERRSLPLGLLGYLTGAFAWTFYKNIGGTTPASFFLQMFLYLVFSILFGFAVAAITQVFMDLLSKKGNAAGMFAIIGISQFVKVLLISFGLIGMAINAGAGWTALAYIVVFFSQITALLYMLGAAYETQKVIVFFAFLFTVALAGLLLLLMFIILPVAVVALITM